MKKSTPEKLDYEKAYYYLHRDRILLRHRKYQKQVGSRTKMLDADRLNKILEQTAPLEKPLSALRGRLFHTYKRSMYNPNFKVPSADKPRKQHSLGFLESHFRERFGYAPPKPRLSRADRQQMKLDARAIKMYHKALRKPKAFQSEMEKAVKDSQLMEYIQGANPQ